MIMAGMSNQVVRIGTGVPMLGRFYEELQVGMKIRHTRGRTVTEMDNILFCALTMNSQPLHINEDFAGTTQFGQRIVNGIFTLGLVVGLTVPELTEGTIVANLSYEKVMHPRPVFHGDTIYAETEVLHKRESQSHPGRGIVRLRHTGVNQRGDVVLEVERTVLFLKRSSEGSA
jgi:acyl dehydratase